MPQLLPADDGEMTIGRSAEINRGASLQIISGNGDATFIALSTSREIEIERHNRKETLRINANLNFESCLAAFFDFLIRRVISAEGRYDILILQFYLIRRLHAIFATTGGPLSLVAISYYLNDAL
jgi:hypothetical protein